MHREKRLLIFPPNFSCPNYWLLPTEDVNKFRNFVTHLFLGIADVMITANQAYDYRLQTAKECLFRNFWTAATLCEFICHVVCPSACAGFRWSFSKSPFTKHRDWESYSKYFVDMWFKFQVSGDLKKLRWKYWASSRKNCKKKFIKLFTLRKMCFTLGSFKGKIVQGQLSLSAKNQRGKRHLSKFMFFKFWKI